MNRFGIQFRSKDHYEWFLISLSMLGIAIIGELWLPGMEILFLFNFVFAMLCLAAIAFTSFGKRERGAYSPDCIWWNGGLSSVAGVINLVLFYLRTR